jgi:DNA repair exonuclease SbcCD ATPase subunit
MSNQLDLQDPQVLVDLGRALGQFAQTVAQALESAGREIQQTMEWLEGRVRHWHRQMDRARRQLEQAQVSLSRCQQLQAMRDSRDDCRREEQALRAAQRLLAETERHLQTAQQWQRRVGEAAQSFQREAHRVQGLIGDNTSKASASLNKMASGYAAIHDGGGGGIDLYDQSKWIYKTVQDLDHDLEWVRITGDIEAARERYEAGIAAQTAGGGASPFGEFFQLAGDLLEAVAALLQNVRAGEGGKSRAEKMEEYLIRRYSISPETFHKLRSEDND